MSTTARTFFRIARDRLRDLYRGPGRATIMSDFGAEVIKIERPQGAILMLPLILPGMAVSEHNYCVLTRETREFSPSICGRAGREVLPSLLRLRTFSSQTTA